MNNDILGNASSLKEYANNLNESEIRFVCNDCLKKLGIEIPPTWYYHDTGRCEGCRCVNDVSVPALNKKANDLGLVIDRSLKANGEVGRNVLWTDRIYKLKRERFND